MHINTDFSQRVVIRPEEFRWTASPLPGIERVMLDRIGGEQARATSLVRYASGSTFTAHVHPGGEEILVLDGVFSDGDQDYPAGTYLRNPPGSAHQPSSAVGAFLFVKLMQLRPDERQPVRLKAFDPGGPTPSQCLFENDSERVDLISLNAFEEYNRTTFEAGAEVLVLKGQLSDEYPALTWLRLPVESHGRFRAGASGAMFYLKSGHLRNVSHE
ncbi:cupin domain-containing protein [Pseudomonas sp. dw_612]|uniref:cupin domain-containing protein n=1 Tax=Pseudomonas sp. dw_612 TaxID=2720080 RepID=UPI001BD510AB|nr:cupin domain-containing protein [Pseudomonas sp. dw_612]